MAQKVAPRKRRDATPGSAASLLPKSEGRNPKEIRNP